MQIYKKAHLQMPMAFSHGVDILKNSLSDMQDSVIDLTYFEGDDEFTITNDINTPEVLNMLVKEGFLTNEEADKISVECVLELTFYS